VPPLSNLLALLAMPCVLTCGGDPVGPVSVAAVVITSPAGTLAIRTLRRSVQLTAEARDADGHVLADRTIAWRTSDPAATISESGLLTALRPGTALVRATSGAVTSAPVTVTIDPMAVSVTLEPDSLTFHTTGLAQSLVIEARDSSGTLVTRAPTVVIENTTVIRLSGDRNVVAVSDGDTRIVATLDGLVDTAHARVALVPASISVPSAIVFGSHTPRTILPVVRDSVSHPITSYAVGFMSGDTAVVSVTAEGLLTPSAEGITDLRVSAGPLTATVPVSVRYVVSSVRILPSPMTFHTIGRPQRARLFGLDSTGTNIGLLPDDAAGRPGAIGWHALGSYYSIAPADTGVDVYPLYNGNDGDPFNMLNASWNSTYEGYALISVRLYPATFGIIAPQTTLAAGTSGTVTGVARDSLDNDLFGRAAFWWLSTDQSVATLESEAGVAEATIRALKPGTTWIHMFGAEREDSVLVTVF